MGYFTYREMMLQTSQGWAKYSYQALPHVFKTRFNVNSKT